MYDEENPPLCTRLLVTTLIIAIFVWIIVGACNEDAKDAKYPLQVQITMQDGSITNVVVPRRNVYQSSCGYTSVTLPDGTKIEAGNSNVTIIDTKGRQ